MKRTAAPHDDQIADPRRPRQSHQTCDKAAERRAQYVVSIGSQFIEKEFELANEQRLRCSSGEIHPLTEPVSGKIGSYNKVIPSKRVDIAVKDIGRVADAMDQQQRGSLALA
jgi:hypothetical protein